MGMTREEIIADKRYHTCGRCRWGDLNDDSYPCNKCIHGTDKREDFWQYAGDEVEEEDSGTLEDKDIILEIDRETLLQEYISKDQYETRLKADLVAILTEIQLELDELWDNDPSYIEGVYDAEKIIQQKIDKLRGNEDGK